MSAPARLAGFAAVLVLLAGGGALAGNAIDPEPGEARADHTGGESEQGAHGVTREEGGDMSAATHDENGSHGGSSGQAGDPVRGLAVAEDNIHVVVDDPELRRGRAEKVRFTILDDRGRTVREFDVGHERRMHLIVARRDLTGFQHLHPEQEPDGSWTVDMELEEAGSYRLFADFTKDGEPHTLATDLRVDGPADLRPLPPASAESISDGGYEVRLDAGAVRPGAEAELRFAVTQNGNPVHVEPYLGADGHLVALREGDLAFLHVHPMTHGHGAGDDDSIGFAATFPTSGRYRLFLQFQHEGTVHTVAFTQEVS